MCIRDSGGSEGIGMGMGFGMANMMMNQNQNQNNNQNTNSSNTPSNNDSAKAQTKEEIMDTLKQLGELKTAGVLSDEEFDAKKKELLARL